MGYYTNYDLTELTEEQVEKAAEVSRYNLSNQYETGQITWYRWNSDMRKVSTMFPDELLTISGVGEESGDIWKAYFLNGKAQICQARIVFEDFDKNKLE